MQKDAHFKVYQASAGAGKTFTLIKEYLKLCLVNEGAVGNYKHILAITFTNAAANEMKGKIVNALCEIINSTTVEPNSMEAILMEELGISDAELKRNAQSLMTCIMHDYSSFCVSTIDAFVQKLSRTFANDLGLPSQYTVSIDTDEVAEAVTENIGLKIRDKEDGEEEDFLTRVLIDFSNNQFDNERSTAIEQQLAEFVTKLTKEKAYQKDEDNNIKDKVQYQQTLDFLNARLVVFENTIKSYVEDFRAVEHKYDLTVNDYWQKKSGVGAFIGKLEKKEYIQPNSYFHTAIEKRKCLSDTSKTEANEALLKILGSLETYYGEEHGKFLFYKSQCNLLYLYALRSIIRDAFKQLADDEQIVHISEFNKLLNKVMGDFSVPFVYERMGERFHHVFVDEFQDTSILQWQNLLPLIDNGLAEKKMSMVVGDGKQSIYRFRSGEVEQIVRLPEIYALPHDEREATFLQYEKNLESNFGFTNLDTNYRSFTQVVDFNNAFFESAYHQLSDKLKKVYVDEKPDSEDGVCIFQKKAKKEEGMVQVEFYDPGEPPDYCKEHVEAIVRELVDQRGYQYEDIAVLTRKKELGSDIASYLNDKNIPVISQESILLKSSDKVQLLVNTLRYLIEDDNVINVANVLYFWKMVRKMQQNTGFDGDISNWFAGVKDIARGNTAIEKVMGIGEAGLLKATLSQSTCIYDLCAALMRIYGLDTIRDAFLNYFMEEVFSAQSGIKEGIKDFLTYWDTKQDKLSVKSVSGNAVKIMTIHKSKGLEFPVVIYPDAITNLDDKLRRNVPNEEWLSPEELGFDAIPSLEKVLLKLDSTAEKMGGKPAEKVQLEKDSNRLDNLNLLYVAFTRAVQRLYVIAKVGTPNVIHDFLKDKTDHQVQESESLMYRFGDPDFRNPKEKALETETAELPDSGSIDWFHSITVDADPTRLWHAESERLQPREWGELVHQILSRIRYPKDTETVLKPYLADGTIDSDTAAWIREMMAKMAQNGQIAAAFQPSAKVKTECEVLYQGQVRRLDRYAELPDAIYLIDYKTGKKDEAHQKQVRTYASALHEMTDKEIRAFLVYLDETGVEVEPVSVG